VKAFSDLWILDLEGTQPQQSTADVLPWILISCVFDEVSVFKSMTKIVQRESSGGIREDHDSLPVPESVIGIRFKSIGILYGELIVSLDKLETCRQEAICEAVAAIDSLIVEYQQPNTHCPRKDGIDGNRVSACDAMVLGALIKSSMEIGLWPVPEEPYDSKSFLSVFLSCTACRHVLGSGLFLDSLYTPRKLFIDTMISILILVYIVRLRVLSTFTIQSSGKFSLVFFFLFLDWGLLALGSLGQQHWEGQQH
jgi:hypothetical protein